MSRSPRAGTFQFGLVPLLLAAAVAALGYVGITHSLAQAIGKVKPDLGYALASYDGAVAARYAARLGSPTASASDRRRADRIARRAVQRDATAVSAVTVLAMNAQIQGNATGARQIFAYSQKLSRRNLATQLWAIEDAVGRNDISGALTHYDIALRTHPQASQMLFPVLSSAAADPSIRKALVAKLSSSPPWWDSFTNYFVGNGPDPLTVARTLFSLRRTGVVVPDETIAAAIGGLLDHGLSDEAWSYYVLSRRGVDRSRSRDPRFLSDIRAPSQLDWIVLDAVGVASGIERSEPAGFFEYAATAGAGGPVLRQMQVLSPGTYRIEGQSTGINQPEGARPYWTLRCGMRELGRVVISASNQEAGRFTGTFEVPAGCKVQSLELVIRPSDAMSGTTGRIDRVQLSPVN